MAIKFLDDLPYTEAGANLKMNELEKDVLRVVYKPSETAPDSYEFYDLWDYKKDYPDDYVAVPVASVLGGVTNEYGAGTEFVNIIGSTDDPKPVADSWIHLMIINGVEHCDSCCAEPALYDPNTRQAIAVNFQCHGRIVGGHIIFGTLSRPGYRGEIVHLLPICNAHNIMHLPGHDVGAGFYMKLRRRQNALTFNNYLNRVIIEQMLEKQGYTEPSNR